MTQTKTLAVAALAALGLLCAPLAQAGKPLRCKASRAADQRWLNAALAEPLDKDDLLSQALRLEGGLARCSGKLEGQTEDGEASTITFDFVSGARLTVESMPGGISIVTLQRQAGLGKPDEWLQALRRYAALRGEPIDWKKPAKVADEANALEYTGVDPNANVRAVVGRDAAGRLVKLSYSLAL